MKIDSAETRLEEVVVGVEKRWSDLRYLMEHAHFAGKTEELLSEVDEQNWILVLTMSVFHKNDSRDW